MKFTALQIPLRTLLVSLALILSMAQSHAADTLSSGSFKGANGHTTTGGVSVVKTANGIKVVLGNNFSFDGAPDPKVGFGKNGKYDIKSQLAHLKSNSGEQTYAVPASLNIDGYNEIYIWCEKYSVSLGVANIK